MTKSIRRPWLASLIVASLALGIGVTSTVVSIAQCFFAPCSSTRLSDSS
ncbi:MAG TPA: hypothetical protein VGS07_04650 [Thermoanaerobaculia bacterium]|jgi:hypothetical protein|nr:hypothetical protein [Thermoanaerobaculia bacterium]